MIVYVARKLVPVASPPRSDAALAVENGRIADVGPRADVLARVGECQVRDLGDVVVLPGLVNAHTHLELSWMRASPPAAEDYVGWVRELVSRREHVEPEGARRAMEDAVRELVASGTVAVGDVANEAWGAPLLARSPLHAVLFHELLGFSAARAEGLLAEAVERLESVHGDPDFAKARDRLRVVLTVHASHSTSAALVKALAGRAAAAREPLSIHVAESKDELRLLHDGSGPFRRFLEERGAWVTGWTPPGHSPVEHLDRLGALSARTLAVHCVHVERPDLSKLQARGATVVTCPRSNRRLNVGKAPVPAMLASGIPVALGTDSLASVPDVNLFHEMEALRQEHPSLAPAAVLRMATLNGARVLGLADRLGTLEEGKLAAAIVVPLPDRDADPLGLLLSSPSGVSPLAEAPWEAA